MLAFALAAFSAIFSVVDPLGAVPVYIAMTAADSREHKRRTALRASLTMGLALAIFAASGVYILHFFGISIGSFRIAGGLLLFLLAVDMLRAQPSRQRTTPEEMQEGTEKPDISVFPLAIPMLSGPGAFATVMMLMTRAHDVWERGFVFVAIALNAGITFAVLLGATVAEKRLGKTGMNVLHRVMGLLLAAIAVQFVVDGAHEVLPAIVGSLHH
ncbi:MAG: MarC family protein [Polyangia bacterium]|jgi:multiple antibiotic resistance protein